MELLDKVLSPENIATALKRVRANKGAPGIDGISTEQLPSYLQEHWDCIKEQILMGAYRPLLSVVTKSVNMMAAESGF